MSRIDIWLSLNRFQNIHCQKLSFGIKHKDWGTLIGSESGENPFFQERNYYSFVKASLYNVALKIVRNDIKVKKYVNDARN